jgi:hypothetical protein
METGRGWFPETPVVFPETTIVLGGVVLGEVVLGGVDLEWLCELASPLDIGTSGLTARVPDALAESPAK